MRDPFTPEEPEPTVLKINLLGTTMAFAVEPESGRIASHVSRSPTIERDRAVPPEPEDLPPPELRLEE